MKTGQEVMAEARRMLNEWMGGGDSSKQGPDVEALVDQAIREVRIEQDKITRHACARAVTQCESSTSSILIRKDQAHAACMNVKAVP